MLLLIERLPVILFIANEKKLISHVTWLPPVNFIVCISLLQLFRVFSPLVGFYADTYVLRQGTVQLSRECAADTIAFITGCSQLYRSSENRKYMRKLRKINKLNNSACIAILRGNPSVRSRPIFCFPF